MKLLRAVSITLVIVTISLVLFEVIARQILPKEFRYVIQNVDHRMLPFSNSDINEDGIRFKGSSKDLQDKKVAVFLGDSFTFGSRLRYDSTIPQQFEKIANTQGHADIRAVNFGWVSSSPVLEERLLHDIGAKYHPQTVFLLLDMTDIWDDNIYTQFLAGNFFTGLGKVLPASSFMLYRILTSNDRLFALMFHVPRHRFFHSDMPLEQTRPLYAITLATLSHIAAYCHDTLHAQFVLVIIPRNYQYNLKEAPQDSARYDGDFRYDNLGPYVDEPFHLFAEYSKTVDFPVIPLLEDFRHSNIFPTTFNNDPHLNPDGAHLAAQAIYTHCQALHCLNK